MYTCCVVWLQYETALVVDLLKRGHPHAEQKVRRQQQQQQHQQQQHHQ
jgi:hypothetical protein